MQSLLAALAHDAVVLAARLPLHPPRRQPGRPSRRDLNLFLTMVIGGLWHGAAWTFVVWGAIHGAALVVERRVMADRERGREGAGRGSPVIRWVVTFHLVCLGWVFFRAESLRHGRSTHAVAAASRPRASGTAVTPMIVFVIVAIDRRRSSCPIEWVERAQVAFSRIGPAVQVVGPGASGSCSSTPSAPRASPPSSTSSSRMTCLRSLRGQPSSARFAVSRLLVGRCVSR